MKTLKVALVAACAVVVGWAFTASADIPASAYVQSGLVVQYDGIENVGRGQAHDDTATTWADLSGNGRDGTCQGETSWTANGLKVESATAANRSTVSFDGSHAAQFTIELGIQVHKASISYARMIAGATDNAEPALCCNGTAAAVPYVYGLGMDKAIGTQTYDSTAFHTTSVRQSGDKADGVQWYNNGALLANAAISSVSTGANPAYLANRATDFARGIDATYYSVRIYSRMLTEAEILVNANIDQMRFAGADSTSLTWPDGCRWNANSGKIEYVVRVNNSALEGGTVTVDGADIGTQYEAWHVFETTCTFTVQATPKPGYVFARWDGADDALTGAQRISPRMTVTVDRPLALTAVYSVALSARAYVQDGLIAQWDAIENAGYGQHDGAPTVWKDLSRSGYDITLPASGVVVSDKTLQLSQTNMVTTIPELSPHCIFHGEAYAAADRDYVSSDTVKDVFYNYQLALFFRNAKTGLVCGAYGKTNGQTAYWYAPGKPTLADVQALHTYSIFSSFGEGSSYSCDGATLSAISASFTSAWPANVYGVNGDLHFGSSEVTLNYGGMRLYKRKLTDAEVAWNAMIDRARFAGEALDPSVTQETIRVVDGVVQYGCKAAADASGFGTVEITVDGEAGTAGECNWFEAGKKTKVVFKAIPAPGKAFVRWEGETTLGNDILISDTFTVEDVPLSLTAVFRETTTKTWVGTSESANVAENWNPVGVPETGDAIVLNGACNQAMTWDIDNVKPGSWLQDGYTGTVTFLTGGPDMTFWKNVTTVHGCDAGGGTKEFCVLGDVDLWSGTWAEQVHPDVNTTPTPADQVASGMFAYRLVVKVGGSFTLGANACVHANGGGSRYGKGPGISGATGGSYGGRGMSADRTQSRCYGSVYRPVCVGSAPGVQAAGGAVRIEAAGAMSIDGMVSADATAGGAGSYTGSGGSVLLVADSIGGSGMVSARGGDSGYCAGGGGRIALVQTGSATDFSRWTGTTTAVGGYKAAETCGAPGTIYFETADRKMCGDLLVKGPGEVYWSYNKNLVGYSRMRTDSLDQRMRAAMLTEVMTETNLTFDTVTISDYAILGVKSSVSLACNRLVCEGYNTNSLSLYGGTVVLPENSTHFANTSFRVFADGSQVRFADDVTEKTLTIGTNCEFVCDASCAIDGNLVVKDAGLIDHTMQYATGTTYHVDLAVAGDLTVAADSKIYADAYGWNDSKALGYAQEGNYRGGSHGGLASLASGAVCYGSVTRPVLAGSSGRGGNAGGGVIRLQVGGLTRIDGLVTASGKPRIYPDSSNKSEYYPQGAGGSIWLTTGSLVGEGRIRADGGYCRACANSGAGGGRIAVWLTEAGADFSDFTVTNITAYGAHTMNTKTNQRAGAGTVYLKTGSQAEDEGTLIIANADGTATDDGVTRISDQVTDTAVGRVVIEQGARLAIAAGSSLTVKDDWTNREPADHFTADLSTDAAIPHAEVKFVDTTKESKITGSNCFANLTCVAPGKTLRFGADEAADLTRVNGVLKLAGEEGNPLAAKSETDGEPWLLDVVGSADVSFVTAWDSDARLGKPVVNIAGTIQRTENWSVVVPIVPGAVNTWTGADAEHPTDWTSAANWSQGRAPVDTDKVVIPADCAAYPTLSANIAYNTLMIEAGATLDLNGYSISVTNALTVAGTLAYKGGETLTLSGSTVDFTGVTLTGPVGKLNVLIEGEANQSVNLADFAFDQVVVSKTAGDVVWGAGFTADKFTCVAVSAMAQTFAAGNRIILRELLLDGSGDGAAKNLTLVSSEPETAWKLKVTQFASVIGVAVSDSDASESAVVIYADQPSQDSGRNRNWNFTRSRATWLGGSGDFTDPAKWSSGEVPDVSTLVIVESNATINVGGDEDPEVQEVRVVGTGNKFGGDRTLKVRGSVQMDGGGLTLDVPLHVENAMFMLNGSVLTHTANAAEDTKSVQLEVAGDLMIDKTSTISAQGKGYSLGKGCPGSKSGNEAAHGGRPRSPSDATACYGSVMCPTNSGSSTDSYGTGGGRIRVVVGGTAIIDGSINANGSDGNWLSAAGGSVWATFGSLTGSGVISANGGKPTNCADGGGGRVAVYLTDSSDFDAFTSAGGVISAYGSRVNASGTLPVSSCGTVYLEGADGKKRIVIDNDGGTENKCLVDFPVPVERGGDDPKLYKDVTLVLRNKGALNVVGEVMVGEVEIETDNAKYPSFFLNDRDFVIRSWAHKRGKGWATWKADAGTAGLGRVVWEPHGMMLFVR